MNLNSYSLTLMNNFSSEVRFILTESLIYNESEIAILPHLKDRWMEVTTLIGRKNLVYSQCPVTHRRFLKYGYKSIFSWGLWSFDDFKLINSSLNLNSRAITAKHYIFSATLYNDSRKASAELVRRELDRNGFIFQKLKDDHSLTLRFENLSKKLEQMDNIFDLEINERAFLSSEIAEIRREIWFFYTDGLRDVELTVSLPSYFKGLPGRVLESFYYGVPAYLPMSNLDFTDLGKLKLVDGLIFEFDELKQWLITKDINNSFFNTIEHYIGNPGNNKSYLFRLFNLVRGIFEKSN